MILQPGPRDGITPADGDAHPGRATRGLDLAGDPRGMFDDCCAEIGASARVG